jgi:8-oxo-dGTP pyrophosphatase MutT (NUDIX family)
MRWVDRLLRVPLTAAHKLLKAGWFVRRPRTYGAHALAFTPRGKLILVKLRYAAGWRFPGGGRHPGEPAEDAALRELQEEIGMTSHGRVRFACEFEQAVDFKQDSAALLIVEDVTYSPGWTWEIEEVAEFSIDALPPDAAPVTLRWIELVRPQLDGEPDKRRPGPRGTRPRIR